MKYLKGDFFTWLYLMFSPTAHLLPLGQTAPLTSWLSSSSSWLKLLSALSKPSGFLDGGSGMSFRLGPLCLRVWFTYPSISNPNPNTTSVYINISVFRDGDASLKHTSVLYISRECYTYVLHSGYSQCSGYTFHIIHNAYIIYAVKNFIMQAWLEL